MSSPLSLQPPQKVRELPRTFLRAELGKYFRSETPPEVVEVDYSLWRCAETGLEFSLPASPGNSAFYEWISGFPYYYPEVRWEYSRVADLLGNDEKWLPDSKILDVGSGKGDFLQSLKLLRSNSKFALDMNEPAVRACREGGLNAYCGTIEAALDGGFLQPSEFAVVTSFHCLEHVSRPVEFVRDLIRVTKPGGRVYVSTPASPMSFELDWFDVLNHPPHHLTRWNLGSYQKLAEILGVEMRYYAPPANTLKQALQLFRLRSSGPNVPINTVTMGWNLLRNFRQFLSDWKSMRARALSDGVSGADVILVELTVPR